MKKLLIKNRIYLNDKQISNLSRLFPKEYIPKYASLVRTISKVPNIEATFTVDELTWHIVCREAAKKRILPKELIRDFTTKEICQLDGDYKIIYPLIRALKV